MLYGAAYYTSFHGQKAEDIVTYRPIYAKDFGIIWARA